MIRRDMFAHQDRGKVLSSDRSIFFTRSEMRLTARSRRRREQAVLTERSDRAL